MRGQRGQATIEWTALLGLLATLMTGAALVWPGVASQIPTAVADGFMRAFCVLRGGNCERDREPCVVAGDSRTNSWEGRVMVAPFVTVELGSGWTALIERLSDGTLKVTRVRADRFGAGAGAGAGGRLTHEQSAVAIGGEARVRALLGYESTLTWTVPDRAAAERLVDGLKADKIATLAGPNLLRLAIDGLTDIPPPETTQRQVGYGITAAIGGSAGPLGGKLDLAAAGAVGHRSLRDGGRIVYLKVQGEVAAGIGIGGSVGGGSGSAGRPTPGPAGGAGPVSLSKPAKAPEPAGPPGGDGVKASGTSVGISGEGSVLLGLELDADGRARDLSLVTNTAFGGRGGGRATEREWHLDLTEPANAQAARAVVAALGRGRPDAAVAAAVGLGERMRDHAVVNERTYELHESEKSLVDVDGGIGGAQVGSASRRTRLVGARTRGPSGQWRERADCLAAV